MAGRGKKIGGVLVKLGLLGLLALMPTDPDMTQPVSVRMAVPAEAAGASASPDRHPALAASRAACRLACRVVRIVWASPPVANPSSEALKSAMTSAAPAKAIGLTA